MSKRARGKYLPVIFSIILSLVLIFGCSSDGNDPNNSALLSSTLPSAMRLTQQEVISIAEEYANEVILPEGKSLLLERYKPPSSDESVIKTVHDIQIFVKADGMYEIGNIKTWFVPSCISYEVTTKFDSLPASRWEPQGEAQPQKQQEKVNSRSRRDAVN